MHFDRLEVRRRSDGTMGALYRRRSEMRTSAFALCAALAVATPALACKGSWGCDYPEEFKNCMPHFDPAHPHANRVPSWAAKQDTSVDADDGSWQHAYCDARHHIVVWCPPSDKPNSECASIFNQLEMTRHTK
jgi:hypothetical protein